MFSKNRKKNNQNHTKYSKCCITETLVYNDAQLYFFFRDIFQENESCITDLQQTG